MGKVEIKSIEKIGNGYICEYITDGANQHGEMRRSYKLYFQSPIQLGRLIMRMLDDGESGETKEE